jgi:uncharacterized spore protein YtfJ
MPLLDEIIADAGKTLGVRRIYGDPYEKNGVTVIPAARVMGGAGGGGATEAALTDAMGAPADSAAASPATGSGVGFGMTGGPVGAFVIKGDNVAWLPAVDVNRLMLGFQIAFVVFFLVMRSIAKTRAKSRLELAKLNRAQGDLNR